MGWFSRLGRLLRFVAGVDEKAMDRVRYLRAWYASLGGAVLMVGVIAAFSMWFAVQQATGANPIVAIVPSLVWFLFIVVIDRWIVSSRSSDAWQRVVLLLTRGTLAILFGVVIAEPLVLKVFENQIVQQVHKERSEHLNQLTAGYIACNPDPADPTAKAAPSDCAANGFDLGIVTALAAEERQLTALEGQAKDLDATIKQERGHLSELQQAAMDECAGVARPGTTGIFGEGINCKRNTQASNDYNGSVPWANQEALLGSLQQQIADLRPKVTDGQKNFTHQRDELIAKRLSDQPQVNDPIGLLQRMEVLRQLAAANVSLAVGVWLVRLLFISIDSSPVLMKIASGRTAYDRWVDGSLEHIVDSHDQRLRTRQSAFRFARDTVEQRRERERDIAVRRARERAIDQRERAYRGEDVGEF